MNNERQKATKRKLVKPKSPSDKKDTKKYMPFRAFKPRDAESKVAGYAKPKRQELGQEKLPKPATPVNTQPAKKKKPDVPKKPPKLSKKINANARRLSGVKEVTGNAKTFDISSFPRVFSTSDLMEKMSEGTNAVHKCSFQQDASDVESTDEELRSDVLVHLMPNSDEKAREEFSHLSFPAANLMVFNHKRRNELEEKLSQTEIDLECKNIDLKNLSNMLQEKTQDLVIKEQKEKILAQKLEQRETQVNKLREENEALKREKNKYDKTIKELQATIHGLEEQAERNNHKGHVKLSEYEKLRERIRDFENEREAMIVDARKLRRELQEKSDLIDSLSRRNDHLQKQNDLLNVTKKENRIYSLEYRVDALQDQVNKVKHENEKLKKTYTYTVSELAEYEMKQMKLREIIDKQKSSLKVLENNTSTENRQAQNYELENLRLREINRNLYAENEKFRQENAHLLNLMSIVPPNNRKGFPPKQIIQHTYKEKPQIEPSHKETPAIVLPPPDRKNTPQETDKKHSPQKVNPPNAREPQETDISENGKPTSEDIPSPSATRKQTPSDTASTDNRLETAPSMNRRQTPQETAPSTNRRKSLQGTASSANRRKTPQETAPSANRRKTPQETAPSANRRKTPQETAPSANRRKTSRESVPSANRKQTPQESKSSTNRKQIPQDRASPTNRKHTPQETALPFNHQHTYQEMPPPLPTRRPTPSKEIPPISAPPISNRRSPQMSISMQEENYNHYEAMPSADLKETPESMAPPPIKFSSNLIPMVPTHRCNETPEIDEKDLALYLVQTPGSTPKRTSGNAFREIQSFKTTIMHALHRNHKPKK